ncbi:MULTISPECIES: LysM peptidoglycan-binding domain-containing protein [Catenuloplanes]|uniref:LysM repeat protein n=1 Tax=Catenuloplanes niger TaxID=587534 RepID=A0AAE4CTF3_9ACTN|nr:LysM domain-containing protein [Catenuloplanes niger]MDR7322228.1 LysM repeat protein [Catenuloplanes niger]
MTSTQISVPRRIARIATGLAGLVLLVGLLGGAPVALYAVAGNPIPDQLPTLDQAINTLTSPDDGQLFLRALALVGWLGWLTFALSVLVELVAMILRVPAPHLPGMRTQQRMATALLASVTLIVSTGAAASASALGLGATHAPATGFAPAAAPSIGIPGDTPLHVGYQSAAPTYTAGFGAAPARPATPDLVGAGFSAPNAWDQGPWSGTPGADPMHAATGNSTAGEAGGQSYRAPAKEAQPGDPVYRVEQDDYLGTIADRYLGDFERYPELAQLNGISDPDRIQVGDFLHLPENARDRGVREHATGLVDAPPPVTAPGGTATPGTPAPDKPAPEKPAPERPAPEPAAPGSTTPGSTTPGTPAPGPSTTAPAPGAAAPGGHATPAPPPAHHGEDPLGGLNGAKGLDGNDRGPLPLAVSAVLAAAAVVGAQVGALLGLRDRRRPRH